MAFSLTPPLPISLVTKMKVASWAVKRSVELGFDGLQCVVYLGGLEEEVRKPERDAVDDDDAARNIVTAEIFLFLNVRPLRTATRLMTAHPLTELFIPHMGGGQIDGIRRKAQGQALGLATLA